MLANPCLRTLWHRLLAALLLTYASLPLWALLLVPSAKVSMPISEPHPSSAADFLLHARGQLCARSSVPQGAPNFPLQSLWPCLSRIHCM